MSRTPLPFHADDISALARALGRQLTACDHQPGHVELLNMLARSIGCRNFQHFRVQGIGRPATPAVPPVPVDSARLERVLRLFDSEGQLTRWPTKLSQQHLCLWVLWSGIPPRQVFHEAEINQRLNARHRFGDHALLRRWLCDLGLMTRTADGREYRRIECRPPAEALALIRRFRAARPHERGAA